MKIYFFSGPAIEIRSAYRTQYIFYNLKIVKSISLVFFVVAAFCLSLVYVFHFHFNLIGNFDEFLDSLSLSFFVMPVFYFASRILIGKFSHTKTYLRVSAAFVVLFAFYLISRGMLGSFYVTNNPRNSVTFYMTWLIATAIFFVFEFYESLFVVGVCVVCFNLLLPLYQTDQAEILKNQLVSVLLISVFYTISRFVYSYRVDHFIQIKTIQEKNEKIENANHLKDEILGIVAHDLRNPLAAIESTAMLMEMDIDSFDESNKENLMMLKAACKKARLIINDLIEVARNDTDEDFEVKKTDLNAFVRSVVKEWSQNKTDPDKIVFHSSAQAVFSLVNKEKMQRVLDNLISNAIKFSNDDSRVEVFVKTVNNKGIIEVKDSGVGIPKDMLPFIFDRFSRAGRLGLRGEESVGLGLSIVRQIIRKHGGEISVESVEKKGSTFRIVLPQILISEPVG